MPECEVLCRIWSFKTVCHKREDLSVTQSLRELRVAMERIKRKSIELCEETSKNQRNS